MGVFDPENSLSIEITPEVGPETTNTEPATQTEDGHVENEDKETQAPETTEETTETTTEDSEETDESESTATQEDETNNQQQDNNKQKLFAGKYKTVGGLVNGITEAAKLLGVTVDWNKLNSPKDMEQVYLELRQEISKGEIKNIIQKPALTTPEEIKQEVQAQQSVFEQELQKIIEASNAALKDLETIDDEEDMDDEEFAVKFAENPKRAIAERDARREAKLRKEFEARLNLEGAKLTQTIFQTIGPFIQKVQSQQEQEAGEKAWATAIDNVSKVIREHGDNDFEELIPDILKYLEKDPEMYDLVNASPNTPGIREKVLSLAYRDIKLNKKLNEFAKTTAEKDNKRIKDSKPGLKIQNGIGGGANNQPRQVDEIDKIFGKRAESTGVFG